ncbi:conserved protein of unknown function [Petrocella atlantisensis]|uniref:Flagellar protein FlgN n=1 Tax=Petrocella atlantisensis TaxID=2173034 RepID=A0A3P7NZ75_9FIRM|nr:flagellar export chaperone FlgN [Petrocella atlantisensis]VDN48554.1 conserved protein of unknown function [Petrocella atlantisensis]
MGDMHLQVDILVEALEKKKVLLEEILDYSKEQSNLLMKEDFNTTSFNNIMSNKQIRIDKLIQIDEGFESAFDRIKSTLKAQPSLYKEAIEKMKQHITEVSDLGVEIQVTEMRNKQRFDLKSQNIKGDVKNFRNQRTAVSSYHNNYNKQKKADQPHFFDSKK